ncbi:MAG: DUF4292 domain-containing protein [Saprospiraceae bacterium]|nr:DUF4292 domain-containing protein [Saprospiraceae bacterium]
MVVKLGGEQAPLPLGAVAGGGADTHRVSTQLTLLLFSLLLLSATCRRRVPDDTITPATTPLSADVLIQKLRQNAPEKINTISAHARIYAESEAGAVEAGANLIWIRDSVLWVNIKKLGIEAVRALVTPDSVIVLNRLEKTVQAKGLDALQREYNLPEGFPLLQHLLLASAWIAPDLHLQADIKDSLHRLAGTNGRYSADYRVEEGAFVLRQATFLQQQDAGLLGLQYGQFKKLPGAGVFPYFRRIEIFSPESGTARLEIEFTEIEINVPKPYRFEIPDHYQRME